MSLRLPAARSALALALALGLAVPAFGGAAVARASDERAAAAPGDAGAGGGDDAGDIPPNFALHPLVAELRLRHDPFRIVEAKRTEHGVAGTLKMRIRFEEDGVEVPVKWKSAPRFQAEGWNNVPRKEVAAYQIQKWFLDPAEYVVPPTVTRCVPLETFRAAGQEVAPTAVALTCAFGTLALWLGHVQEVERVWDRERFRHDPVYARSLGAVNLLGYLIQHRDGRKSNFLISTVPGDPRMFSVDNGISFGARLFNFFVPNAEKIRVPALPAPYLERLRQLDFDEVAALGVLGQYRRTAEGGLEWEPPDPDLGPAQGSRLVGDVFQYGLTRDEISELWERLGELLVDVHLGRIALLPDPGEPPEAPTP